MFLVYSYTKRFTWVCHLVLGLACGGAPVGAWIAVTGRIDLIPLIIGGAMMLWVAGFDIIYGTQDIEFDRNNNIYSIPSFFGLEKALWISRVFHSIMILMLLSLYWLTPTLGVIYITGIIISIPLLIIEHYSVVPGNKEKMNLASYHLNQIISVLIFVMGTIDVFIG